MKNASQFLTEVATPAVVHFNTLIGNTPDKYGSEELWKTYLGLIREEGKEYFKAVAEGNLVEQLDAICDLLYVGGFYAFVTNEKFWHEESWVSSLHSLITNPHDYQYSCDDLIQMLEDPANYKFDIAGAFLRVTESNLTKAPLITQVNLQAELDYLEEFEKRYSGISYRLVGDRVVFTATKDEETGEEFPEEAPKIIKPSTFMSVKALGGLEEFINE